MEWLFRTVDCNSAVLTKLRENWYRIGIDVPTVQEARDQIPGASGETDAPFATGRATNLFQGCMENQARPYFDSDRHRAYCQGVSGSVSSLLSPERLGAYSRAFWTLGRDAFDQRVDPAITRAMTDCMR